MKPAAFEVHPHLNPQRVYNVFHHLSDQSLPHDHWDDAAELAAMIYLLKVHSEPDAFAIYVRTMQAWIDSNKRVGIPMPPFDVDVAAERLAEVSHTMSTFPGDDSPGRIYLAMVDSANR